MSQIFEQIAERHAEQKADAKAKVEIEINKLASGADFVFEIHAPLCEQAGVTLQWLADRVEKRMKLLDDIRISNERPIHESRQSEADHHLLRIDDEEKAAKEKFDTERKVWRNQRNAALAAIQLCRDAGSNVVRNSDDQAIVAMKEQATAYANESKSIERSLYEIARQKSFFESIVNRGLFPNGSSTTRTDVEKAKIDLESLKKREIELTRRNELLKLIVPIAHENLLRHATGLDLLPYPIDYRRGPLGQIIAIYEHENSELQAAEPTVATVAPAQDVVKEQNAATSSSPSAPTRTRAKQATAPMASDLDLI